MTTVIDVLLRHHSYSINTHNLKAMKNRLRLLRAEHDWSQADLADRVSVSRQAINAVETGRNDPSLHLAMTLARLFGLSVEDVFSLEEAPGDLPVY